MRLQPIFSSNAFENKKILLIPHPPRDFGLAKRSHFSQGCMFLSPDPDQMKREKIFLIFYKVPFGIQASNI